MTECKGCGMPLDETEAVVIAGEDYCPECAEKEHEAQNQERD